MNCFKSWILLLLFNRYENLKAEMAQGIPLGPEATTNKNIYDIYLKSKYKI